jgi:hypothetical protein
VLLISVSCVLLLTDSVLCRSRIYSYPRCNKRLNFNFKNLSRLSWSLSLLINNIRRHYACFTVAAGDPPQAHFTALNTEEKRELNVWPTRVDLIFPLFLEWRLWSTCMLLTSHLSSEEGQGSSVGVVTLYGLEGPGFEPWCGRDFPHPSRPVPRPIQPPIHWVPGLFDGGKAVRERRWPPTTF